MWLNELPLPSGFEDTWLKEELPHPSAAPGQAASLWFFTGWGCQDKIYLAPNLGQGLQQHAAPF